MPRQAAAAVFLSPGLPLDLRTLTVPDPVGSEILVRVIGCTLCGSDRHTFEGRRSTPTPTILGHEILGRIADFGQEAPRADLAGQPLREGDRVTWAVVASCGECFYCKRDLLQKCECMIKYGHERLVDLPRGGLAEYCALAPGTAIVKVPESLSDRVACPASCATATVAAGMRLAGPIRERFVLVQGAGMLGLTACAMASAAGAAAVICTDVVPDRLVRATVFGATATADPRSLPGVVVDVTGGYGVDVALELTGAPEAFEAGLPLLRIGGTYVLIGAVFPSRPVPVAMEMLVRRQWTVRGVHNYAPVDLAAALEFLAAVDRPFDTLVEGWYALSEAEDCFRRSADPSVFRVGVRP